MIGPNYRTLESLEPYDDIEDLVKAISDRDAYINKLESFIEQDNDILDAYNAWCEDWWDE